MMRIAIFHTATVLSSWTVLTAAHDIRRMGHEVLEGSIPVDANGAVLNSLTPRLFESYRAGMPTAAQLDSCDILLVFGPEYVGRWLCSLYGVDGWQKLRCGVRAACYLETSQEAGRDFRYELYRPWYDLHFYPARVDVERFGGLPLPPCVDTRMFCPRNPEALVSGGALNEKKYEAGFVGTIYPKRAAFLSQLLPLLDGVDFRAGSVVARDLGGELPELWTELLVRSIRQLRIHVALPSNNVRMTVSRPFETLACGTFLLTYRNADDFFADGEHCRFYDPDRPEELARLIRYYCSHAEEREEIALAGCRYVHERFSRASMLAGLLETCRQYRRTPIAATTAAVAPILAPALCAEPNH
jgi:glycosyltransferase involved in cell wall biosynthesis